MLRSMFAAVSGLRAHQQMMDVIGNNIANVNTTGFKSSSVQFEDMLSEMTGGPQAPTALQGGTDPNQVGLGVTVAGVSTSFTQGASQYTGRSTDLAIQGDGFLMASSGGQVMYTRNGSLTLDASGNLVTPDGGIVQGWLADPATHTVNTNTQPGNLTFPSGQVLPPQASANVVVGGDLPADAVAPQAGPPPVPGTVIDTGVTLYDQQGTAVPITLEFSFQSANSWQVVAKDASGKVISGSTQTLTFDPKTGQLSPAVNYSVTPTTGVWQAPVHIDFGQPGGANALVQFAGQPNVKVVSQDGSPVGSLESFNIAQDGTVTGVFSNGQTIPLGQIALANFTNPGGLEKAGGSLYRATINSGLAQVGVPGTSGRGTLSAGSLEMSNVDLAQEFTSLIVAQRGFQANSRVITTADQILQDLVNLKQ